MEALIGKQLNETLKGDTKRIHYHETSKGDIKKETSKRKHSNDTLTRDTKINIKTRHENETLKGDINNKTLN